MTNRPLGKCSRYFRFQLRTLLVVVFVVSVPLMWLTSQWRMVAERKAVAKWVWEHNGEVDGQGVLFYDSPHPFRLRRLLGDRFAWCVYMSKPVTPAEYDRIVEAFPEAKQMIARKRD